MKKKFLIFVLFCLGFLVSGNNVFAFSYSRTPIENISSLPLNINFTSSDNFFSNCISIGMDYCSRISIGFFPVGPLIDSIYNGDCFTFEVPIGQNINNFNINKIYFPKKVLGSIVIFGHPNLEENNNSCPNIYSNSQDIIFLEGNELNKIFTPLTADIALENIGGAMEQESTNLAVNIIHNYFPFVIIIGIIGFLITYFVALVRLFK